MGLFSKKKVSKNWKDDVRSLAEEGKIMNSSVPLSDRVCGTCQQPLGTGIHNSLIIRDNEENIYEIHYHGIESCFNLDKIRKQLASIGHEILYKSQESNLESDDENLKSFLRESLFDKNNS